MSETPFDIETLTDEQRFQLNVDGERKDILKQWEDAEEIRQAFPLWLEQHGVDPDVVTHHFMKKEEFELFSMAGIGSDDRSFDIDKTRRNYGISLDQKYAWVDVEPINEELPIKPLLVDISDDDFGTVVGPVPVYVDQFEPDTDPNSPVGPDRLDGTFMAVDIFETISSSYGSLDFLAENIMEQVKVDPFDTTYGNIGVRAGDISVDQNDAFIWTASPITNSVAVTLLGDTKYDSICVVRGQKRDASNGKSGMAQIVNPEVVLKIEGENLKKLQEIYKKLYSQPDYAISEDQKSQRDALFNNTFIKQISEAAKTNSSRSSKKSQLKERTIKR